MSWKSDKAAGEEFQDYVKKVLYSDGISAHFYSSSKFQLSEGEGPSGIEVKLDRASEKTGNYYIEIAQETIAGVVPSGLYVKSAFWLLAIGTARLFYLVPRNILMRLHESEKYDVATCRASGDTPTHGILIPIERMDECAALKYVDGIRCKRPLFTSAQMRFMECKTGKRFDSDGNEVPVVEPPF